MYFDILLGAIVHTLIDLLLRNVRPIKVCVCVRIPTGASKHTLMDLLLRNLLCSSEMDVPLLRVG